MKQYLLKPLWWEQGGTPAEACTIYPELFSDCFLTELSVYKRQRVGETACVYVCEAEGGDTTPPPVDWASLTGWRGRWGHRNKANTHTHFFLMAVMSSFLFLFPASALPSFHNLLKKPPSLTDLLPPRPRMSLYVSSASRPCPCPNPFLSDCTLILTCSH